jgi:hypothetical protein
VISRSIGNHSIPLPAYGNLFRHSPGTLRQAGLCAIRYDRKFAGERIKIVGRPRTMTCAHSISIIALIPGTKLAILRLYDKQNADHLAHFICVNLATMKEVGFCSAPGIVYSMSSPFFSTECCTMAFLYDPFDGCVFFELRLSFLSCCQVNACQSSNRDCTTSREWQNPNELEGSEYSVTSVSAHAQKYTLSRCER